MCLMLFNSHKLWSLFKWFNLYRMLKFWPWNCFRKVKSFKIFIYFKDVLPIVRLDSMKILLLQHLLKFVCLAWPIAFPVQTIQHVVNATLPILGILLQEVVNLRLQVVLQDSTIIQLLLLVWNAQMQCGVVKYVLIVQYALNVPLV